MAWEILSWCWITSLIILHIFCIKQVSGNWSTWTQWSEGDCSVTCGVGTRTWKRTRFCHNADNNCVGSREDKKRISCFSGHSCEDLECYECNIFNNGKIIPCEQMEVQNNCRACMKSLTRISLHDRLGYTKDSIVESRLCVKHKDFSVKSEGCEYRKNNGGISILCHCFSDRCNSGARQGSSVGVFLFLGLVGKLLQGLLIRPEK